MAKTIEYYLSLPYRIEIFPEDGGNGFTAGIPDLPGCLTSGDTIEGTLASLEEAKRLWLEVTLEDGRHVPEPTEVRVEEYSGKILVRMPRSLHRRLASRADQEGSSLNQLIVAALSEAVGSWQVGAPTPTMLEVWTPILTEDLARVGVQQFEFISQPITAEWEKPPVVRVIRSKSKETRIEGSYVPISATVR